MTSLITCVLVVGIQGPVIVAQAGDTVMVHFKNLASQPYSISPVGITYWKQSEGSQRFHFPTDTLYMRQQHTVLLVHFLTQHFDSFTIPC